MTIANGSVTPESISAWRSAISGSNLLIRSRAGAVVSVIGSALELFDRIDQLADRLDLGLHVHRDQDVEFVLDRGDEIHHRQAVPFAIALNGLRPKTGREARRERVWQYV